MKKKIEMSKLRPSLPLAHESHVLTRSCKKMNWPLASVLGIAVGIFGFFMRVYTREDAVFNSKPDYYKGCTIFSSRDSDFQGDEMFRLIGGLSLSCENNRFIYITSYKFSDRTSLVLCRNPLGGKEAPRCHSVYYIENMRK